MCFYHSETALDSYSFILFAGALHQLKQIIAVEARRASFTPSVTSVDSFLGRESAHFLKRLADHFFSHWSKPYSEVMRWLRARMFFATIRAIDLCLRDSRVKWRSGTSLDDGAGLPLVRFEGELTMRRTQTRGRHVGTLVSLTKQTRHGLLVSSLDHLYFFRTPAIGFHV